MSDVPKIERAYDPLALINAYARRPDRNEWTDAEAFDIVDDAVRAVLDLHEPFTLIASRRDPKPVGCEHCSNVPDFVDWPCPTVRAITDILQARQPEPPKPPSPPNPCYWSGGIRVHVKPGCRCGSRLSQGLERLMP